MKAPYPLPTTTPLTGEQVKEKFLAAGVTFTDWARDNGYRVQKVYFVLNGQLKGRYGEAHKIAVALGMKLQAQKAAA
jgi:gp16 family phage-associated protein